MTTERNDSESQFSDLSTISSHLFQSFETVLERYSPQPKLREIGTIVYIGNGVARVSGLASVQIEELVSFPDNVHGLVFNLDPDETGIIMLGHSDSLRAGTEVKRTGRVIDIPVGEELLGRTVNALGQPLDGKGTLEVAKRYPIERNAPSIMDRSPVTVPLETGLKVIDALIPIGRGQRELILGDRQTGKTAIAMDAIVHQKDSGVLCVYCSIGQRSSTIAQLTADLFDRAAFSHCVFVVAAGEDPPGMRYIAPYAATAIAEYFMDRGKDVMIVYDDLTQHALAYRELSLLLRRPPGREAYPGDIFYIHSRLLERATHLRDALGGGSLTALPIIETEAQNVSAYIPTNLISITDGQIYLSPDLFKKGVLPAVDPSKSVSRVGGKTQFPAFREVAGNLRLSYAQFIELEKFARFSTRLDEETERSLDRGRRVREILKQQRYTTLPAAHQVTVLLAVNEGLFDAIPLESVRHYEEEILRMVTDNLPDICSRINRGKPLSDDDRQRILIMAEKATTTEATQNKGTHEDG